MSLVFGMFACALLRANEKDSLVKAITYETGVVQLHGGIARLSIPQGFKFLNAQQSHRVYTQLWGYPPQPDMIGMVFPGNGGPYTDSSYAFVITYRAMGHVRDEDADQLNFDDVLKHMQQQEEIDNAKRRAMGFPDVHVLGWAQKPFYDKNKKVLHWAKEMQLGDKTGHTLNYGVCILGRKGILSMNAIGAMHQLDAVQENIASVLQMAAFNKGNRHNDFDPQIDEVANWTLSGLVTGKAPHHANMFTARFSNLFILVLVLAGVCTAKIIHFKQSNQS